MFTRFLPPYLQFSQLRSNIITLVLLVANLLFNIFANASFKLSVGIGSVRGFIAWQVVGNLAGFITVITLTGCCAICLCMWHFQSPRVWQSSACTWFLAGFSLVRMYQQVIG